MPCNSTGGGGGGSAMNATTNPQITVTPQNFEWQSGDVDGYKNNGSYLEANQMFGAKDGASTSAPYTQHSGATKDWLFSINSDERKGVKHYTGSSYWDINDGLRKGDISSLGGTDKKSISGTTEALKKGVVPEPFIAHRGSSAHLITGTDTCTLQDIQSRIGSVVADKAFVSSSAVNGKGFSGEVKYHIKTPAGKGIGAYVDPISLHKGGTESEFLFQRGSKFKIVGGYVDSKGQLHCNMEYVGNSF